jgi:subtilisin family serine protease
MFSVQFGKPQVSSTGGNISSNVTLSPEAEQFISSLKENPAVEAVYNDGLVSIQAQTLPNDQNRVDADLSATRSGDGSGNVDADIAIIDTGVQQDHPDLNVFNCVSFVGNPTPNVPLGTCSDGQGHGTHVAGTAAAKDNDIGVVGKAPGARIWAIKVLGDDGFGSFSDILEGVNYVAAHANEIDVVNMSLGGTGTYPPLEAALTDLVNTKGVVVVVAAGNNHQDANNFTPARTPAVISVSAEADSDGKCGGTGAATFAGPDDSFATFSNYGLGVDMAAPGVDVYSTYKNSGYATMSGTSMASPNVAGAAALYKSLHPTASPIDVETYLKNVGTKAPASGDPLVPCDGRGKGYFTFTQDLDAAREPLLYMAQAQVCPPGPLTGQWKNDDGGRYYIRQCEKTVWWAGLSNDGDGTLFTNVFKGTITSLVRPPLLSNSTPVTPPPVIHPPLPIPVRNIVGQWCDVPRGTIMNCGLLTLKIISDNTLRKVSFTGGFGGSIWTRIP